MIKLKFLFKNFEALCYAIVYLAILAIILFSSDKNLKSATYRLFIFDC